MSHFYKYIKVIFIVNRWKHSKHSKWVKTMNGWSTKFSMSFTYFWSLFLLSSFLGTKYGNSLFNIKIKWIRSCQPHFNLAVWVKQDNGHHNTAYSLFLYYVCITYWFLNTFIKGSLVWILNQLQRCQILWMLDKDFFFFI